MLTIIHRYERKGIAGLLRADDVIVQDSDGKFTYGDGEPCPGVSTGFDMAELIAMGTWEEIGPGKARRKEAR